MSEPPRPMLASPGALPAPAVEDRYGFEMKWDGVRALVVVSAGRVRLWSRTAKALNYPELAGLADAVPADSILDGEVVVFDDTGRVSFEALQRRMMGTRKTATWMGFDVLRLAGRDLTGRPYTERRAALEDLGLAAPCWQVPPYLTGSGAEALEISRGARLEGVVAKLLTSRYEPGRRSPAWIKVKHVATQAVVVGGWRPGRGGLAGGLGSVLVGLPAADGTLIYAGRVGTGLTLDARRLLQTRLEGLAGKENPFGSTVPRPDARDAVWVRPELVGEVAFTEWTREGRLRAPVWRGVREDVLPADIVRES
jgi:bifunctional non-homologous end joining protein LigD